MKRVAVFGKPGGGKSTFSNKLSVLTGIPSYSLDLIRYQANGKPVAADDYANRHAALISEDRWIIEGLGTLPSFWQRIAAADTLVYIDLPYRVHYWWVTKRLLNSGFVQPLGWPEGSSVLKGTLASWRYLRLSPTFWTPELLEKIQASSQDKTVYHITSVRALNALIASCAP